MSVAWHCNKLIPFSQLEQIATQLRQISYYQEQLPFAVQAQVNQNLVVPAPAGVDLFPKVTKLFSQKILYLCVNILVFPLQLKPALLIQLNYCSKLLSQSLEFSPAQNPNLLQHFRMRH
jgi:hypothetical protein